MNFQKFAEKHNMDSNGYAYFHAGNFRDNPTLPCYIPENAEDEFDVFSREDLNNEVIDWLEREDTKEYLLEANNGVMPEIDEDYIESWVYMLFEELEWTFPSTHLENYSM
ncbi:MAG: hypothetical protein WD512_20310 [Candidatus Paceibacterota bacterium]